MTKKLYKFNNLFVEIDFRNKYVSSINFENEELIHGKLPFFVIKLRDRDANKEYINASQFEFVSFDGTNAIYKHEKVDVVVSINQLENGLKWGVSIKNHTSKIIEQVELMTVGFNKELEEECGTGEVVIPYNEGARITSLKEGMITDLLIEKLIIHLTERHTFIQI